MSKHQPTIAVKIIGGLGNQLFQHAYAYFLGKTLNGQVCMDIGGFKSYELRDFLLSKLNVSILECDANALRPLGLLGKNRYAFAASKRLIRGGGKLGLPYKYLREQDYIFDVESLQHSRWIYLDGYWQHFQHLNLIRPELIKMFSPKEKITPLQLPNRPTVGVHIRRGDYVTNANTNKLLGVLPLSYYQQAFELLTRKSGEELIPVMFSDDPDWVKENVHLSPNQIVSGKGDTISDFFNLSRCQHQIIANSTFSWWAAWLNENHKKMVTAPSRWFAGREHDINQMIPKEWELI